MTLQLEGHILRYRLIAASLHIAGVVLFVLLSDIESRPDITLVQSSVRVDVVQMPTLTKKELDRAILTQKDLEETVVKKEPIETAPNEVPEEKSLDLSGLLKNLSKKKVDKNKILPPSKKADKKQQEAVKKLLLEGNIISKGSAKTASNNYEFESEYTSFMSQVRDAIKVNWALPTYLKDRGLSASVKITIARDGRVLTKSFIKKSGDDEFDKRVMQSISDARPPSPDKKIATRAVTKGFALYFPL